MNEKQRTITETLGVQANIDPLAEIERRTRFLQDQLAETGLHGYVLGISGGQDSLLAGLLAQRAVEARRAEGYDASFHAVLLPYGEQADAADARDAIACIGPDYTHAFNVKATTDALAETFGEATGQALSDFNKGNVKARVRMTAQYALAGTYGLMVIGTDHAAEAVTGFFTKYGDGGADLTPLSGLSKRQGKALLQALGVPAKFITKQPTADLLDGRPGQTDESELGLTYDTIDTYLEGGQIDPAAAQAIESRHDTTEHKRQVPVAYTTA